jgi:hypothetical protein
MANVLVRKYGTKKVLACVVFKVLEQQKGTNIPIVQVLNLFVLRKQRDQVKWQPWLLYISDTLPHERRLYRAVWPWRILLASFA